MATHSSVLACRIPWTEDPGRLQSIGSQKSWTLLKGLSMAQHSMVSVLIFWFQALYCCQKIITLGEGGSEVYRELSTIYVNQSKSKIRMDLFIYFIWGRILVPQQRIKPVSPSVESWSLNHQTSREVPTQRI